MNTLQNNPNDSHWLAAYAHNRLTPIIRSLPGQTDKVYAYLYLSITESPRHAGLDIWVHAEGFGGGVLDYATVNVTKETVDRIAERLPAKWAEALQAAGVTA